MPIGEHPFEGIAMDYVVPQLESEGFQAILVVKDQLTKVEYYIPAKTAWPAADVVDTYINEI